MPVRERFDHLRHGALELLAAGNSSASVAQLLGVPVSVVMRWRDEPAPPRPEPVATVAATAVRPAGLGFRTTLVHAAGWRYRLANYALATWVACVLAIDIARYLRDGGGGWIGHLGLLVNGFFIGAGFLFWLRLSRPGLTLGPSTMSVPGWVGVRTMPYSDLADWWLVMHVQREGTDHECEGRLLTLHSRHAGVRPLEVFIRDCDPLDPRIVDRLDRVKQANLGVQPLTPLGSASTA